ncbi:MAG: hypothetical protein LBR85_08060 [Oscillospiraceae bacterium]|jgi:adenylosuccinate synthase|nr:hypothetical protein [Oscillospiraceae bacterium]
MPGDFMKAIYVPAFMREIKASGVPSEICGDEKIVMPYHLDMDTYEAERTGERPAAPSPSPLEALSFAADSALGASFRVEELFGAQDLLLRKLVRVCAIKNTLLEYLYNKPLIDPGAMLELLLAWREQLRPYYKKQVI